MVKSFGVGPTTLEPLRGWLSTVLDGAMSPRANSLYKEKTCLAAGMFLFSTGGKPHAAHVFDWKATVDSGLPLQPAKDE